MRVGGIPIVWVGVFALTTLVFASPSLAQRGQRGGEQERKFGVYDRPAVGSEPGFEAGVETAAVRFDVHDLSGAWRSVAGGLETIGPNVPPMTPAGMARINQRVSADRVDNPAKSNDPQFKCNPQGFPRLWLDQEVIENIHTPDRILQLSQWEEIVREIWMDGRKLPTQAELAQLRPRFYGYSVGRWQGDTLIVDTVGLDERNWIDDDYGLALSNEARVEERYRRVGPDVIAVQYILYDPKFYTAPWVGDIKPWRRMPRQMMTHSGWFGTFSGVTEAICAPANESEYHENNLPLYGTK
jgi:hypothetical protein